MSTVQGHTLDQRGVEVEDLSRSLGAELYGVASADEYTVRFPDKPSPGIFVQNARSVVVVGLPFEPGTVDTVLRPELASAGLRSRSDDPVGEFAPPGAGKGGGSAARRWFLGPENAVLVRELEWISYRIAKHLRREGWRSLHIPPSKQNGTFRTTPFYHMPAMYLAGMGTLGLNCSILTPEFGARVFVTSIITDCPLPAGKPMDQDLCTHCDLCVDNCPIGAIDGQGWKNPYACASYGCCSTCIAICPVGADRSG